MVISETVLGNLMQVSGKSSGGLSRFIFHAILDCQRKFLILFPFEAINH